METITNAANIAAKAVWGEKDETQEPISGTTGDVTKGEPYDAGNLEPEKQKKLSTDMESGQDVRSGLPGTDTTTDTTTVPTTGTTTGITSGITTGAGLSNDTRDSALGQTDPTASTAQSSALGDDLKPNSPSTPAASTTAVKDADLTSSNSPAVGSAPEAPADAQSASLPTGPNQVETSEPNPVGSKEKPLTTKTDDKDKDDKAQGSGTEVVHATGLAADGGDFDAANPGAGQEADRLMAEKGMHRETQGGDSSKDSKDGKDKPSIKDRIKAKLHRN